MSYAPKNLLDLRDYLKAETGLSENELGIVGDAVHSYGYHLGEDRLPKGDYSARTKRDIAGLTDAASATDIGQFPRLVELTLWLVNEARAGRTPDIREIIGPAPDGRAYRYDSVSGWGAQQRSPGDAHEWHCHISWYRDSEGRGKTALFRRFFEGLDDGMALSDDDAQALIWRVEALFNNRPEVVGGPRKGEANAVHAALAALTTGGVDIAALAKALAPLMAPLLAVGMETAAEVAVRKVLGAVDGATPQA